MLIGMIKREIKAMLMKYEKASISIMPILRLRNLRRKNPGRNAMNTKPKNILNREGKNREMLPTTIVTRINRFRASVCLDAYKLCSW
jgi:hypothetical protein